MDNNGLEGQMVNYKFGSVTRALWVNINASGLNVGTGSLNVTSGGAIINNLLANLNASAVLQADSTTKGFLPPRMTNTQRTNIVSPAIGLMVYCTDATEGLYIYKSTGWTFII
jgi:hypothetical protein